MNPSVRVDAPLAQRAVLLVDNGSSRAEAVLSLRRIAQGLSARLGEPVEPVSLLHADRIPPAQLGGQPAEVLEGALNRLLAQGVRELVILPLFFGRSAALTRFIPERLARLASQFRDLRLRIAPELCPLPPGEPRLVRILCDQIAHAAAPLVKTQRFRVVLVDHGSPSAEVSAVRGWLAGQLSSRLDPGVVLYEAAMERRPGPEYDFNGPLLEERLAELAEQDALTPIVLALLFISPGRHAGPSGDIARICEDIRSRFPALPLLTSPLVGEHPGLIELLAERFYALAP